MAEGFSTAAANALLDTLGTTYSYIQLHTAAPGAAGTTAIAGNATRKQVTWAAASSATMSNSAALTWSTSEVDTSEDYTHFTLWTLSSAGSFGASGTVTASAVTAADEFEIAIGDLDLSVPVAS